MPKKRKERTPPDNEQTRKLRSRVEEPEAEEGVKIDGGEDIDIELDDEKPRGNAYTVEHSKVDGRL